MKDYFDDIHIPLTIEKQLKYYSEHPDHIDRHEILWHTWNQNKVMLSQMLEYTSVTFQTYSKHDQSHANSVLHNMEKVLGEEQIKKLSATDCFCLLHAAYTHDLGMCLTFNGKQKLLSSKEFSDIIKEIEMGNDIDLLNAVKQLKKTNYEDDLSCQADNNLYIEKLKDYNAILLLISEAQRKRHSYTSAEIIDDWVNKTGDSNSVFFSNIPSRIYKKIACCCKLHTDSDFSKILDDLRQNEDGFINDHFHPRFIAVMLQLGDLLDIDNNRFNPFILQMNGPSMPNASKIHYNKHKSIVGLDISNEEICIEADCDSTEELRQLRLECDWLTNLLQSASYYWSSIVPKEIDCRLPSLSDVHLMYKGKDVPAELVTAKFRIEQKKAFKLLQGTNIYETPYVFIRELIQNASDSSKMQYWNNLLSHYSQWESSKKIKIIEANQVISLDDFPIKINIALCKCNNNTYHLIRNKSDFNKTEENIGLLLSIQDFGTGLSKSDLELIMRVGSSHDGKIDIINSMPDWLKPSGCFGIGLQSLFNLNDNFTCTTKTRTGEAYKIIFNSGVSNGFVNVETLSDIESNKLPYGAKFEIFISEAYKVSHSKNMVGWAGFDPLEIGYSEMRPIRRSREMLLQLIDYINKIICTSLFPVYVNVEPFEINKNLSMNKNSINLANYENIVLTFEKDFAKLNAKRKNWINENIVSNENYSYCLNSEMGSIHIWDDDKSLSFGINSKIILPRSSNSNNIRLSKTRIYYKGLFVQEITDSSLVSFIDIKSALDKDFLELNRSCFTDDGIKYIKEELIVRCDSLLKDVFKSISNQSVNNLAHNKRIILSLLEKRIKELNRENIEYSHTFFRF